jgi:hypothetical protein
MKTTSEEAQQVFRQFAWHLAGKLVRANPMPAKRAARPARGSKAGAR